MPEHSSSGGGSYGGLLVLIGIGLAAGVVMALLTVYGPARTGLAGRAALTTPIPDRVAVGKPAPDFTAQTLDGDTVALSGLRGQPVAVNFWATWCVPCEVEMPELESASARYANQGLVVLGVNAGEDALIVRKFVEQVGVTFPIVLDPDSAILDLYEVRAFPTTVWVDAEGMVFAEHLGPLTSDLIDRYMRQILSPATDTPSATLH